jgi:hypothetical protein
MRALLSKVVLTAGLLPLAGLTGGCVYEEHDYHRPRREVIVEEERPHRDVVIEEPRREVIREDVVIVEEEPPAPRVEVRGHAPSHEHAWIEGHYVRTNGHWDWRAGHWERPPRRNAVWVPGHWNRKDRHYVWIDGHWKW